MFAHSWLTLIGVALMLTAFFRTCPAYSIMTMDTVEKDAPEKK